jgi:hypothetical protein
MYQSPALVEALVRDRVAELQQSAATSARGRRVKRRPRAPGAARQATGWLLVDMGLRLATPRSAISHAARGEQR